MKVSSPIFPKLIAMASLEQSEKKVRIEKIHTNTSHLVKKIVKIGLTDPEIIWVDLKKRN